MTRALCPKCPLCGARTPLRPNPLRYECTGCDYRKPLAMRAPPAAPPAPAPAPPPPASVTRLIARDPTDGIARGITIRADLAPLPALRSIHYAEPGGVGGSPSV